MISLLRFSFFYVWLSGNLFAHGYRWYLYDRLLVIIKFHNLREGARSSLSVQFQSVSKEGSGTLRFNNAGFLPGSILRASALFPGFRIFRMHSVCVSCCVIDAGSQIYTDYTVLIWQYSIVI